MNKNFLRAIDDLSITKDKVIKLLEEGRVEGKTYEDKRAGYIIENIIEEMDDAIYRLRRYSWPAIEGRLLEDPDRGKFELICNDSGKGIGYEFSCGSYIEIFDDETHQWYSGRVEHTSRDNKKGYYFYNNELDHPFLFTGMRARVRREPSL